MTPIEEFKLFLLRHDLPLSPALDIVKVDPDLLNKYSMEELAILSNYVATPMKPVQKQVKIRPLVYSCCQLMAMKEKKSLVDWLDTTLSKACEELLTKEINHLLKDVNRKLSR
jgi:hypothetical protein